MKYEATRWRRYGSGAETAMARIEDELSHQWDEAQDGGRAVVNRIRVLTLVAYGPDGRRKGGVPELPAQLAVRHPCRVIAVSHDPAAPENEVTAQASTHCVLSPVKAEGSAGRQVCCEEIRLRAQGDVRREIRAAVAALTIPHLPVFLWWQADISGRESILEELSDLADRVILDSRSFSSLAAGIARLKILSARGGSIVSDLEWARLVPWRTLLARTFDTTETRPYVRRISGISVDVDGEGTATAQGVLQGLYLISWLSGRLGWASEAAHWLSDDELAVDFRRGPKSVRAVVRGRNIRRPAATAAGGPEEERAGITAVEISAGDSPFPTMVTGGQPIGDSLRLDVHRTAEPDCVCLKLEIRDRTERRTVRLGAKSLADLIADELDAAGRDTVYEATLAGLARVLASMGRSAV